MEHFTPLSPSAQNKKAVEKARYRMQNLLAHAPTYQANGTLEELHALSRKPSTIPALQQQWDEVKKTIPVSPMSCKYVERILSESLVKLNNPPDLLMLQASFWQSMLESGILQSV